MPKQQTHKLEPRRRKVKILATIGPASSVPTRVIASSETTPRE